ncbi:MAG: hypothetical protein ABSH22_19335, partial [Tepidisphaeraceae bacterium]
MFLRKLRPRGRGKKQIYWELVESYRSAKGSRQRTVAYLGKLSRNQINGWQTLSSRLNGQAPSTPGLFDPPGKDACREPGRTDEPEFELVEVKSIAVQRLRSFGDVYLAWTLWRLLGLDVLLS